MISQLKDAFINIKSKSTIDNSTVIPIDKITCPIKPLYYDSTLITRLAGSIKTLGLILPIHLFKEEKSNEYILLSGQKRLNAFKLLEKDKISAKIIHNTIEADRFLISEFLSSSQNDIFKACSILKYMLECRNYDLRDLSEMSGLSITEMSKYKSLELLRHDERRQLVRARVPLDICSAIAEMNDDDIRCQTTLKVSSKIDINSIVGERSIYKRKYSFDSKLIDNSVENLVNSIKNTGVSVELEKNGDINTLSYTISVKAK